MVSVEHTLQIQTQPIQCADLHLSVRLSDAIIVLSLSLTLHSHTSVNPLAHTVFSTTDASNISAADAQIKDYKSISSVYDVYMHLESTIIH